MATRSEDVTDGGQNGPSGSVENENDAMLAAGRLLNEILIGKRGELTPEAQTLIDLRSDEGRMEILDQLVRELAPSDVSPAMWREWLSGGLSPFSSKGLKKPVRLNQGLGKTISRGPKSLKQHRDRVEKARAELAFAEETLAYHEAVDKSLMDLSVYDHLLKVLAPIFAMGPAWTVMRALSGHAPDKYVEDMTALLDGKGKEKEAEKVRKDYAAETADLLVGLDFFSGIAEFELRLRAAVKEVVEEFEERKDEVVTDGRRKRSQDRMMNSVNPEAVDGAEEVIDAFG
ncbi:hypothetical protein [Erythrobacter aureus]|uniref:Uncharacterized protein n=1 Tax=Erythrobacter aureus TaxID=2182384 RepID=A0A345YIN7_9SPHN|nr:hypothetical protein [Erythrobacter aureus]AXK43789.1 hypothetical protein DVR09_15140 [Erythrobacter aureus]